MKAIYGSIEVLAIDLHHIPRPFEAFVQFSEPKYNKNMFKNEIAKYSIL